MIESLHKSQYYDLMEIICCSSIKNNDYSLIKLRQALVVERPAQVVKELVVSQYSGSRKIRIEIEDGGFSRLPVIDDGHGIPKEELIGD